MLPIREVFLDHFAERTVLRERRTAHVFVLAAHPVLKKLTVQESLQAWGTWLRFGLASS